MPFGHLAVRRTLLVQRCGLIVPFGRFEMVYWSIPSESGSHNLYLIDGEAIKIAGAIQDISMLNWKEYLLLTEHGAVYVLHTSPDHPGEECAVVEAEPVADGVAALYGCCMVKEDGTYCVFEHGTVSETDVLTLNLLSIAKNGKITSKGMLGTASLRRVSPEYRNAGLTIGIICFVLLRRKSRG